MDRPAAALASLLLLAAPDALLAQGGRGGSWSPPSAAEWNRPLRIAWQRSVEDAEALSKALGKPLLVCVNMDGESASEAYAGRFYRDPEFAALFDAFVPIIVSPNRHAARDHDDAGRRIACPRFGSITCGEHLDVEAVAFERYFDGQRVAPRHVAIALGGKKLFDCFLNMDVSPVLEGLRGVAAGAPTIRDAQPRPERAASELLASRVAADRAAVEAAYVAGDASARRALLEAARKHADAEPHELLRLGLADPDAALRALARKALAETASANAVPLVADAIRGTEDATERNTLLGALERLSKGSARARIAAIVYRALGTESKAIDVKAWVSACRKEATPDPADADADALERRIDDLLAKRKASPKDGKLPLGIARATLRLAELRMGMRKDPSFLLADARSAAEEAVQLGGPKAAARAIQCKAAWLAGAYEDAYGFAREAAPKLLDDASSADTAFALAIFAGSYVRDIGKANEETKPWPPEWLTDAHAAYRVLAIHPVPMPEQAVAHVDLLNQVGAPDVAAAALKQAMARFPESSGIHDRYRARVLAEKGLEGLEPAYAALVAETPDSAGLRWFAGYATLVVAEFHKRGLRDDEAAAAYGRAIDLFETSVEVNPWYRDTASHYVALALAGRGRIALEKGDLESAVGDLVACVERRPEAVESEDGLGRTPQITLMALRGTLEREEKADLLAKLRAALEDANVELPEPTWGRPPSSPPTAPPAKQGG